MWVGERGGFIQSSVLLSSAHDPTGLQGTTLLRRRRD